MKNKTFYLILLSVAAVLTVLTAAHLVYAIYAYGHCSIIYFIGRELW